MNFLKTKESRLVIADLSKKGSIDEAIVPLIDIINASSYYFTTSSCSGRICIFQEASGIQKKGCEWLYITHELSSNQQLEECVPNITGNAFFKFEPFVLHVQCSDIEKARILHEAAIASGFRNSGISIGKKGKIITAVRSTHGLEVPLSKDGHILVSTEYLHYIAQLANEKMEENFRRIDRFTSNFKIALEKIKDDNINSKDNNGQGRRNKKSINCIPKTGNMSNRGPRLSGNQTMKMEERGQRLSGDQPMNTEEGGQSLEDPQMNTCKTSQGLTDITINTNEKGQRLRDSPINTDGEDIEISCLFNNQ
ncbi:tRNA wybutosine-synthesizing protein 3 homolog [Antedon mediterranea]|uniref:tRNA wybutosine-synthesizing protein 3 homolog n=1 Tax=Antedon mediterranea TaxID=105859 RepID=UPI003AF61C27